MIVVASKLAPCIFCFLSIDAYFVRYHFQFKILTNSMKQTGRYRASWGIIAKWFTFNWPLCEEATQNRSGFGQNTYNEPEPRYSMQKVKVKTQLDSINHLGEMIIDL